MKHLQIALAVSALLSIPVAVQAAPVYNATITSIYGGPGNPDSGWATNTTGNLELGLQLKNSIPPVTTNTNGVYSIALNVNPSESLQFSINTNLLGGGSNLAQSLDTFTLSGTNVNTSASLFTPINVETFFSDNAFGTNSTADTTGTGGANPATTGLFSAEGSSFNIMQNSEKLSFGFLGSVNGAVDGTYDFDLTALNSAGAIIDQVQVTAVFGSGGTSVPDQASSAGLIVLGLLGLGLAYRQRRVRATAA